LYANRNKKSALNGSFLMPQKLSICDCLLPGYILVIVKTMNEYLEIDGKISTYGAGWLKFNLKGLYYGK
jgi:hypothetical protein